MGVERTMTWALGIGLAIVAFSLLFLGTGAPAWVPEVLLAAGTGAMITALLITMLAATRERAREHTRLVAHARGSEHARKHRRTGGSH